MASFKVFSIIALVFAGVFAAQAEQQQGLRQKKFIYPYSYGLSASYPVAPVASAVAAPIAAYAAPAVAPLATTYTAPAVAAAPIIPAAPAVATTHFATPFAAAPFAASPFAPSIF